MYKNIDKLVKMNKYVYMFFQYGLENYGNRIILTNNRFFMIDEVGNIVLIKNIRTIKDLILNCCNSLDNKDLYKQLQHKFKV